MEVVEKEKETIKEVPAGYYHDKYGCYEGRYGTAPFASKGIAGTGLGLVSMYLLWVIYSLEEVE